MKPVRPGLGLGRDDAGRCLTKLGVIIGGRDFGFGDRIEVGVDHDYAQNRVAVVGSIQLERGPAEVLSIHHDLTGLLGVLAGGVLPAQELGSGREELKVGEVAIEDRQVLDLFLAELCRDVCALGLQHGNCRGYLNGLGDLA